MCNENGIRLLNLFFHIYNLLLEVYILNSLIVQLLLQSFRFRLLVDATFCCRHSILFE